VRCRPNHNFHSIFGAIDASIKTAFNGREDRAHVFQLKGGAQSLCRELRVSRAHLYRAFASRGGVSQVIMLRRLEHAFAALRSPDTAARSIGSIAYAAGFANESHFSRVFRAHYGMSPSKVREAAPRLPGSSGEHPMHQWLLEAWGAR